MRTVKINASLRNNGGLREMGWKVVWSEWSRSVRICGEEKVSKPPPAAEAAERFCDLFNAALNHGSSVHSAIKIQYFLCQS
jgi:hypothetical protein